MSKTPAVERPQRTELAARDGGERSLLLLLFFLSGVAALIYQVTWFRMLHMVFGVTGFAMATVLSAFMAGLALGNLVGGRIIDRRKTPLLFFACLQFGIVLFAVAFPSIVGGITAVFVQIRRVWHGSFYVFSLMRFVLVFGVLLVPTTLMGATLPVLARHFVRRPGKLGADVGALYSVNNWGAALGALAAGFVLMELLGVRETSYVAAAINLGIGLSAWTLSRRAPAPDAAGEIVTPARAPEEEASAAPLYPRHVLHIVLWVFALEGFTSLGYEVVWTRILSASYVVITTYAYSLVVATFIAGLAIGSLLVRRYIDGGKDLLKLLGGIEIAVGVAAVLLLPLFKFSEQVFQWMEPRLAGSWVMWTAGTAGWLALLILVPTVLMGATFPIVSKIYATNFRQLGRRIGVVGCLDTVGSIFGAFAGAFVMIPLLGMQKSVLALAALNVAIGLAVIFSHPRLNWKWKSIVAAALVPVGIAACLLVPTDVQFLPWNSADADIEQGRGFYIADYKEGVDATVVVRHHFASDHRTLDVNGIPVAGTGRVLKTTQKVQAHLPLLLYEAHNGKPAESVLTIGLGSGSTSWSLALHDELKRVHCVELLKEVKQSAQENFQDLNHNVFDVPKYHVFIEDARTFVLASEKKYDVIMDDSVHPGFQGNANLYSRDFFSNCRQCLTERGVMSVWIPVYRISDDDLKMIFNAFMDVFPHATLWLPNNGLNKHMVLVGASEKLRIDLPKMIARMQDEKVREDLAVVDLDDPLFLLGSLLMDEEALREFSRGGKTHTDNHPYLAFSCPRSRRRYGVDDPWLDRIDRMRASSGSVIPYVTRFGRDPEEAQGNRQRLQTQIKLTDILRKAYRLFYSKKGNEALAEAERGLQLDGRNKSCLLVWSQSECLVAQGEFRAALELKRKELVQSAIRRCSGVLEKNPDFAMAHWTLGRIALKTGNLNQAIMSAEKAIQCDPERATRRYSLAWLYTGRGDFQKAQEQLRKLQQIFPGNPTVEKRLEEVRALARPDFQQ